LTDRTFTVALSTAADARSGDERAMSCAQETLELGLVLSELAATLWDIFTRQFVSGSAGERRE
jgi:hypothetical protein